MSRGSKYNEMSDFYTLLNAFINTHKATNTETNDRKSRILSYVVPLLGYLQKNYDSKNVKDEKKNRD